LNRQALYRFFFFLSACLLVLASCRKEPPATTAAKARPEDPVMAAHNIELLFSSSGRIEARLTSPLMNRYEGDVPRQEFPAGFKATMFDSLDRPSTTITANRGVRKVNVRIMEAWGDVVVRNEMKNEQLNTEHLLWDEMNHRIWSDVKVRITRPDQILNGNSLEADDSFTRYSINQASGLMNVGQDSI
jgi:LPS export ABC transporter protein LptC